MSQWLASTLSKSSNRSKILLWMTSLWRASTRSRCAQPASRRSDTAAAVWVVARRWGLYVSSRSSRMNGTSTAVNRRRTDANINGSICHGRRFVLTLGRTMNGMEILYAKPCILGNIYSTTGPQNGSILLCWILMLRRFLSQLPY